MPFDNTIHFTLNSVILENNVVNNFQFCALFISLFISIVLLINTENIVDTDNVIFLIKTSLFLKKNIVLKAFWLLFFFWKKQYDFYIVSSACFEILLEIEKDSAQLRAFFAHK